MTSIADLKTEFSAACTTFDAFATESTETGSTLKELEARANAKEKAFRPVQTSWTAVTTAADWDDDRAIKGKYEASLSRFHDMTRDLRTAIIQRNNEGRSAQESED